MARLFLLFILAVAMGPNAFAQDVKPGETLAGNACSLLATAILTGADVSAPSNAEAISQDITLCNAHPRHEECLNIKRLIEGNGKTVPELTCAGVLTEEAIAEEACSLAGNAILTGIVVGNLRENIARCNKHPKRQSCLLTKKLVEQRNNGNARGLTCE